MADDEKERFHRALDFMKMLGISQSVVAPVLRRLVKVYLSPSLVSYLFEENIIYFLISETSNSV
jgi:hypothetical protein